MKKWMKKIMIPAMVLTLLTVTGCGNNDTDNTNTGNSDNTPSSASVGSQTIESSEPAEEAVNLGGTISTNGSTSMEKVIASLIEAFTADHPDVTITYDATGSGSGITAATEGSADIGLSSRNLKDSEAGLDATVIALDGIAVIANNANSIDDLSLEQIAGLFSGEITNWKEVGGEDAPIAVIGREAGSGTRDGFESIVGVAEKCAYDQELTSTGAVITAVSSNEYAIGYASLSAVSSNVKSVTVGGVECTEDAVVNGTYAIQRPFVMVTLSGKELSAEVQAFIEFALSADATDIIANAGAIQPR